MYTNKLVIFALVALQYLVAAQNTTVPAIPQCALSCMELYVPQSTCSFTDQQCICANQDLQANLTQCVTEGCTVKESLTTRNYTATACGMPQRDNSAILPQVSIPLLIIATFFIIARVASRLHAQELGADDWTIITAYVLTVGFTVVLVKLSQTGLGKDVWNVPFEKVTETLQLFTALEKLYILIAWIMKIAILLLFLRLFPSPQLRKIMKGTMFFCIAAVFCLFWACMFKCWPISYSWTYWDGEHEGSCSSMSAQGWANASLNMAADLFVLLLPLPTLYKLQLSKQKKLGVMAMFSVGAIVTIVSIIRLHTMKLFTFSNNATWDFVELSLWSAIEIYVGLICACMPGMRSFYSRFISRKPSTTSQPSSVSVSTGSNAKKTSDIKVISDFSISEYNMNSMDELRPKRDSNKKDFVQVSDEESLHDKQPNSGRCQSWGWGR